MGQSKLSAVFLGEPTLLTSSDPLPTKVPISKSHHTCGLGRGAHSVPTGKVRSSPRSGHYFSGCSYSVLLRGCSVNIPFLLRPSPAVRGMHGGSCRRQLSPCCPRGEAAGSLGSCQRGTITWTTSRKRRVKGTSQMFPERARSGHGSSLWLTTLGSSGPQGDIPSSGNRRSPLPSQEGGEKE